jgi:hypothetical protein
MNRREAAGRMLAWLERVPAEHRHTVPLSADGHQLRHPPTVASTREHHAQPEPGEPQPDEPEAG